MSDSTLTIDERTAPSMTINHAQRIADADRAGRVSVEHDGSWKIVVDVPMTETTVPPNDVPMDEWDENVSAASDDDIDALKNQLDVLTGDATVESAELRGDYERLVVRYD
jgi:hypothetical protein